MIKNASRARGYVAAARMHYGEGSEQHTEALQKLASAQAVDALNKYLELADKAGGLTRIEKTRLLSIFVDVPYLIPLIDRGSLTREQDAILHVSKRALRAARMAVTNDPDYRYDDLDQDLYLFESN